MLRLNLILNNLVGSLQNVIEGNTLKRQEHREPDGTAQKFDFIVSNPPFNLDFSDYRDTIAADTVRFWAGVPAVPKGTKDKPGKPEKMKIFLCFIQHMLNALKDGKGKGAIVVPTGFITSKQGIEKNILSHVVDEKIVYGCVSMPSNVFATTGTNVSVLFFDNSRRHDKVVLIDASKLGEKRKDGKNQRTFLRSRRSSARSSTRNPRTAFRSSSRMRRLRRRATGFLPDSISTSKSNMSTFLQRSSRSASPISRPPSRKCRRKVPRSTRPSPPTSRSWSW